MVSDQPVAVDGVSALEMRINSLESQIATLSWLHAELSWSYQQLVLRMAIAQLTQILGQN